jgi:hypothetical protein
LEWWRNRALLKFLDNLVAVLYGAPSLSGVRRGVLTVPETQKSLFTKEGVLELADTLFESARGNFERDGHLVPVAFLLAQRDPETQKPYPRTGVLPVVVDFGPNGDHKSQAIQAVKALGEKADAFAVIWIAEAWMKTMGKEATQTDLDRMQQNGVEAEADRTECIHAILDHPQLQRMWVAPITRDSAGKPTLGSFKSADVAPGVNQFGRLASFIEPRPKAQA